MKNVHVYVVVNFLSQVIFVSLLFLSMVMYANEVCLVIIYLLFFFTHSHNIKIKHYKRCSILLNHI